MQVADNQKFPFVSNELATGHWGSSSLVSICQSPILQNIMLRSNCIVSNPPCQEGGLLLCNYPTKKRVLVGQEKIGIMGITG